MHLRSRTIALTAAALCLAGAPAAVAADDDLVIRGAGWGHGIGMSQYGAYGYAKHGFDYKAILRRYYSETALSTVSPRPTIRVLLQAGTRRARFTNAVRAGSRRLSRSRTYGVTAAGNRVTLRSSSGRSLGTFDAPLRVVTARGATLMLRGTAGNGVRDGRYRGAFEFRPVAGGVNAINAIGLEDYIRGVVPRESPASWPAEALKAQAVAARTYAITTSAGGSAGFDAYPDVRSQVYGGVTAETATTDAAVRATRGEVVTYGGRPAVTYFFSTSGGHTENVEFSFVGALPKPWLRGVDDPFDKASPKHRWGPIRLSRGAADRKLGGLVKGSFRRIEVVKRGVSPRVVHADIVGSEGRTRVTGPTLRARLGLNDTWAYFSIGSAKPAGEEPGAPGDPESGGTPPPPNGNMSRR